MEQNDLKLIKRREFSTDIDKTLVFEVYSNLWSIMTFHNGNVVYKLGEQDFEYIINRFISAFETKDQKYMDHKIDGNMVFEICRLKVDEYSITGKYTEEELVLYILKNDSYNLEIDTIEISEKRRMNWLRNLVEFSLELKDLENQRHKKTRRKKRAAKLVNLLSKLKKLLHVK